MRVYTNRQIKLIELFKYIWKKYRCIIIMPPKTVEMSDRETHL